MKKNRFIFLLLLLFFPIHGTNQTDDLLEKLQDQGVQFVHLMFTEPINAQLKEIIIPINKFQAAYTTGLSFDSSSIPGFGNAKGKDQITQSDMVIKLDPQTYSIIPWTETTIDACFMCDVYLNENDEYRGDPRTILKRVIAQASDLGFDFFVGPEIEFFLTKLNTSGTSTPQDVIDQDNYFAAQTSSGLQQFKCAVLESLQAQDIDVEKWHHEVATGQHEISIKYCDALTMADHIVLAKHLIKVLANSAGLHASFMPKPLFGKNGSGMHLNFSLFDKKKQTNAFFDAHNAYQLSQTALYFIAGILNRLKEITLIMNPTINSYKRLVPGYEAPRNICWGQINRSSTIRIPLNRGDEKATRAELRSPDALCNPYLAFAALLQAGLEGVKNKEQIMDSIDENVFHLTDKELELRNIGTLPTSLHQAIDLFEQSNFAKELCGEQLFKEIIREKREVARAFNVTITNWEIDHYF